MKYRQIKWLILLLPTLTIALWEYVRHAFCSLTSQWTWEMFFLRCLSFCNACLCPLFIFYFRKNTRGTKARKEKKAALIEREKLARELHDGIAQSLFLLSVKMNKFGRKTT